MQLIGLISVRKLLDYFYTQQDLSWLDHLLPEDDRRKAEDEGQKLECGVQLVAPPKRPVAVSTRRDFVSSKLRRASATTYLLCLSCLTYHSARWAFVRAHVSDNGGAILPR